MNILDLRSMDPASLKKAPTPENRVVLPQVTRRCVNTINSRAARSSFQSYQLSSLSWQYALLLPCCVRPISSPPQIMGTPCESRSNARQFRFCRSLRSLMTGSAVGPSTPPFQLRLSSFRHSCFHHSLRCAYGRRDEIVECESIVRRDEIDARKGAPPAHTVQVAAPGQPVPQLRHLASIPFHVPPDVSRYLPFHSAQPTGKLPT